VTGRAYPWIASCALAIGCNAVFGLDDDNTFLALDGPLADATPDAGVQTCLTESFDQPRPDIWTSTPAVFPFMVSSGTIQFEIEGTDITSEVGLIGKQTFDLTGGAIEITVVDPSAIDAEAGVFVTIDDDNSFAIVTRSNQLGMYYSTTMMNTALITESTDTRLRVRHDPATGTIVWETAAAPMQRTAPQPILKPSAVTVSVLGRSRTANVVDTVILDDLAVMALCP